MNSPKKSTSRLLWAIYSIFIVYGTTFPFSLRRPFGSFSEMASIIEWSPLSNIPDMVQNVLLFLPFGFLGYFSLIYKSSWKKKCAIILMGGTLSLFVECLQIFAKTRHPSFSDLILNSLGSAMGVGFGVLLKKSVLGFKSHPEYRKFLDAPSAFPAFIFLMLLVAGSCEPFNFTLDFGGVLHRIKPLIQNPFRFTLLKDDLFAFVQFFLTALFMCRILQEGGWKRPAKYGLMLMILIGFILESTQIIIPARYPEVQDLLVGMLGSTLGVIAFFFPGFREKPWIWSLAGGIALFLSALMRALYPYQFLESRTDFHWVLFQAQFSQTTAQSIGTFLANMMVYFPIGFLVGYFFPKKRFAFLYAAGATLTFAFLVEFLQGWVVGRYSDITSVFGAVMGCLLGSLVLSRGWPAFTLYMRQHDDSQV